MGDGGKELLDEQFDKHLKKKREKEEEKRLSQRSELLRRMGEEERAGKEKFWEVPGGRDTDIFKEDIKDKKLR